MKTPETPRLPHQTVWVTHKGDEIFPRDMSTEHLYHALNVCVRKKQRRLLAAATAAPSESVRKQYMDLATDNDYLRSLVVYEMPVTLVMEEEYLGRQGATA